MVALMVSVYPTVHANPALNRLVQQYPDALKAFIGFGGEVDYLSPAGYLGSELFSFMVPLLLLVAAIGAGARAIAGEEEAGTLELLLSCPVSRRRVVLEKLAALAIEGAGRGGGLLAGSHRSALARLCRGLSHPCGLRPFCSPGHPDVGTGDAAAFPEIFGPRG